MGKLESLENRALDDFKGSLKYQTMTADEKAIADQQSGIMKSIGPQTLASIGLISDSAGSVRKMTDAEAKSILPPDQYAIYQARNQEAQSLASGVLPDYMKRELDTTNNAILGAANRRLGPGGSYTSTPGNTALNQVQQNTAETVGRNRAGQVGLMNSYYGLSAQPIQAQTGLLGAGQSVLKNVYYPFHNWDSDMNTANLTAQAALAGNKMTQIGSAGRQAFGGQ